jgi:hypothetical protein
MPYETLSENLKAAIDGLWKINRDEWNNANQEERDLMIEKVMGHLKGKLTNDELGYLTETNSHTAVRILSRGM